MPAEVLAITAGVDVQHDRLEVTLCGWTEDGVAVVLGHRVIWGEFGEEATWAELDDLLRQTFPHALGGRIGIDAAAIDAGDGASMPAVTKFCTPRLRRKVLAIKGAPGFARPVIERASSKAKGRACAACGGPIPETLRKGTRFCSGPCRERAQSARRRKAAS